MSKDIEWLKEEMDSMHRKRDLDRNPDEWFISKTALLKAIDQLDESEVLSEYWIEQKSIDTHVDTLSGEIQVTFRLDDLQNLLVPTLSEIKKVQLSQKTAGELNRYKELGYSLKDLLVIASSKQAQEKLARAWLDGFTIANEETEVKKDSGCDDK